VLFYFPKRFIILYLLLDLIHLSQFYRCVAQVYSSFFFLVCGYLIHVAPYFSSIELLLHLYQKSVTLMGIMKHMCNPSTLETGRLHVQGQPVWHSEFQASLGYVVRACLNSRNPNNNNSEFTTCFCTTGNIFFTF
jgi:hypothetical protein